MAGRPKQRAANVNLSQVGIEVLCEQVVSGLSLRKIAEAHAVSDTLLFFFLNRPENKELYTQAKRLKAQALADQALDLADSATGMDVQARKLQVDTRRWLTGVLDRETFAEAQKPTVTVNIANLHLDALRHRQADMRQQRAIEPVLDIAAGE